MTDAVVAGSPSRLSRNQVRAFWAAWAGWALDGMDSFIYALVLVPALTELLPRSGVAATPGNVGYYGGVLFALFLVGWGLSMVWGPVADRFGRVRTLTLTILCYAAFTFLGAFATTVWQLAAFRPNPNRDLSAGSNQLFSDSPANSPRSTRHDSRLAGKIKLNAHGCASRLPLALQR